MSTLFCLTTSKRDSHTLTCYITHTPNQSNIATVLLLSVQENVQEAQDRLLAAKVSQVASANHHCNTDPHFKVGDLMMLLTRNRRHNYLSGRNKQVAKFMPQYNGPYHVNTVNHGTSTYTLDLPASSWISPTFHISHLR